MKNTVRIHKKLKPPPQGTEWLWGSQPGLKFHGYFYKGWVFALCWGGTAFCRPCKSEEEARLTTALMDHLKEYGVIRHCNKTGWWMWDYHSSIAINDKLTMTCNHLNGTVELVK